MLFASTRSCRESARLILEREDRPLDWRERTRLAVHLRICAACPRFEQQIALMRTALGRWRNDPDGGASGGSARRGGD